MSKRQSRNGQVEPMKLEDVTSFHLEQETGNLADNYESRPQERSSAFPKKPESFAAHLGSTSLHGARFLIEGHVFRRLFWLVSILFSLAYCLFQLHFALLYYVESPFVTQITLNDDYGTNFPAVTLCNFNAINKRKFMMLFNKTDETADQEIAALAHMRSPTTKTSRKIQVSKMLKHFINTNGSILDMESLFSHQIEEMLLPEELDSCTLNGVRCNASNFTSFVNYQYSMCYTINSGRNSSPIRSNKAGAQNGLTLLLNLEQDGYTPSIRNRLVGLKVLVHHQSISPLPIIDDLGFSVEPGKHSFCSMKKKEIINLQSPHKTNCSNRQLTFFSNNSNYSKEACLQECRYREAMETCKCQPAGILETEYPICSTKELILCFHPAHGEDILQHSCRRNCPEPCHYFHYETQVTQAPLLEDGMARDLVTTLKNKRNPTLNYMYKTLLSKKITAAEKREYVRKNIVSLTIYFEELQYQRIEQVPSFGVTQLMMALGGNLGLFLGMSVLTVLEFADFCVRWLLFFVLGKLKKPSRP